MEKTEVKRKLNYEKKGTRGITLIALVVTIIVLLILAGISIQMLTGENGILKRAKQAREATDEAAEQEQKDLAQINAMMSEENVEYKDKNGDKAIIPAGFAMTERKGESTVKEGLVITDAEGNEFVWIPINKEDLTVVGTDKEMAELAEDGENYRGVLYNFEGITSSKIKYDSSSNREPDILTSYDTDEQEYLDKIGLTQKAFKQEMQDNYNAMIKSVQTYGGFYIGRYEISYENGKVQSKSGKTPMSAADDNKQMWYGMYDKLKKYASSNESLKNVVESSMIWGSQYDAMLNYALEGKDKEKVTATSNADHNLKKPTMTGETLDDKILNIYDLEGNLYEWTLEGKRADARVNRGGYFYSSFSASERCEYEPNKTSGDFSSRLTLYIL